MNIKKNILVFPCGSETALELHKAVSMSAHFNLIGANSVPDHGRFVFESYTDLLPFVTDTDFISTLKTICKKYNIDAVYPTMDLVISILKKEEAALGVKVIAPPAEICEICLSKSKTYMLLKKYMRVPRIYIQNENINFPVFCKPDTGYGARNNAVIKTKAELELHLSKNKGALILEFLDGAEYTVDCFSNKRRELLFCHARERRRISNGISVNTYPVADNTEFAALAGIINERMNMRGAWFFQVKRDSYGNLCLLEVAARFAGSSAVFRNTGVNFPLLTLYDAFNYDVEILKNNYEIEMDRALDNRYKTSVSYNEAFVDFDDCMVLNNKLNLSLVTFIYQCINNKIKVTLLSRHGGNLKDVLEQHRIAAAFDRIIQLNKEEPKSLYIDNKNSVFIDDSFAERKEVHQSLGIPVFSTSMIECLINNTGVVMNNKVSNLDINYLKQIRSNVACFLTKMSEKYDAPDMRILDIAPQKHEGAKAYFRKGQIKIMDINAEYSPDYVADLCNTNEAIIPRSSFDIVVCTEVLEHVLNPFNAVCEIKRILKPGGVTLVSTPFNFRIHGPLPDCWRFTVHGLKELFKEFKIISINELEAKSRFLAPVHYTLEAVLYPPPPSWAGYSNKDLREKIIYFYITVIL